ncbi:hypothetical protein BDY19DRAFT_761730 [Irpex rosettiformis]|uniref:Uncharacterized protein n=1 Tax=Irpex rosettiformis TaxID=378272 RepID=A0ACB8U7U3_9APHY|nr:hypothetical protein BDY19DRAFT_761730 [Irpex rosettiformis]
MSSLATAFAYANALPAGPVVADAGHRAMKTKTSVGLGLGLPTEVLHTSIASSKSACVGLGIYTPDSDFANGGCGLVMGTVNPLTSDDDEDMFATSSTSPEMMGTRLPRRRLPLLPSPTFTDSDYAPMRTPSPSLMAKQMTPPRVLFAFAPPSVPKLSLIDSEVSEGWDLSSGLPSTESISTGLNLLCLSDEELMDYIPSGIVDVDDDKSQAVGLGLSLAELNGPDLMLTLHEHGFRDNKLKDSNSNVSSNSASTTTTSILSSSPPSSSCFFNPLFSGKTCTHLSPYLLPHLTSRYLTEGYMAHPKPRKAKVCVGFSLEDGTPVVDMIITESSSSEQMEEKNECPTLGFESPEFWEKYLGVLYGHP